MNSRQWQVGAETMWMSGLGEAELFQAAWWYWDNQSDDPTISAARVLQAQFLFNVAAQHASERRNEALISAIEDLGYTIENALANQSNEVWLDEIADHLASLNFNGEWILENWNAWREDPTSVERKRPEQDKKRKTSSTRSTRDNSDSSEAQNINAPDESNAPLDVVDPVDPIVELVQKDFDYAMNFLSKLNPGNTFKWEDIIDGCALESARTILYVGESMGIIQSKFATRTSKGDIKHGEIRFNFMPNDPQKAEILKLFTINAKHDGK